MSYIQQLLSDEHIRQLCISALQDAEALDAALEAIYREGFSGTPQQENIGRIFVRRLREVRQEYEAQLGALLADPESWKKKQLRLAEDPDAMVCSLTILAGAVLAAEWEQQESLQLLDRRMAAGRMTPEQNLALVQSFIRVNMTPLFPGGQVPRISREIAEQFAGILAMCTYVSVKREPDQKILPDLSFDAVCIWSNTMTEVLCLAEGAAPEAAATVGCVMAAQYMHISEWPVLKECVGSLCALSYPTMDAIVNLIHSRLLQHLENRDRLYRLEWVWTENPEPGFSQWILLLRNQQFATPRQKTAATEAEETYTWDRESRRQDES